MEAFGSNESELITSLKQAIAIGEIASSHLGEAQVQLQKVIKKLKPKNEPMMEILLHEDRIGFDVLVDPHALRGEIRLTFRAPDFCGYIPTKCFSCDIKSALVRRRWGISNSKPAKEHRRRLAQCLQHFLDLQKNELRRMLPLARHPRLFPSFTHCEQAMKK